MTSRTTSAGSVAAQRLAKPRRDTRYFVPSGFGLVEFATSDRDSERRSCTITEVSAVGLTFVAEAASGLAPGVRLTDAGLRVGDCNMEGTIRVLNLRELTPSSVVVGCLFDPSAGAAEASWAAMIAGMEVAAGAKRDTEHGEVLFQMRCGTCHRALRVYESSSSGDQPLVAKCGKCPASHSLVLGQDNSGLDAVRRNARELARTSGIDLAGAYSVQLRVTTLDQLQELCAEWDALAAPTSEPPTLIDLNIGFAEDPDTLEDPTESFTANHQEVVARLIARHGLSRPLALAVANRKLSLPEAVRLAASAKDHPTGPPEKQGSGRKQPWVLIAALVLCVGLAVVGRVLNESNPSPDPSLGPEMSVAQRRALAATKVRRDAARRVTEVTGPDPASVLIAYCRSDSPTGVPRKPLAIASPPSLESGLRIGIFSEDDVRYAIKILKKEGRLEWVAGVGDEPVAVARAPEFPPGHPQIPIQ